MRSFKPAASVTAIAVKHCLRLHLELAAFCNNNAGKKFPSFCAKLKLVRVSVYSPCRLTEPIVSKAANLS